MDRLDCPPSPDYRAELRVDARPLACLLERSPQPETAIAHASGVERRELAAVRTGARAGQARPTCALSIADAICDWAAADLWELYVPLHPVRPLLADAGARRLGCDPARHDQLAAGRTGGRAARSCHDRPVGLVSRALALEACAIAGVALGWVLADREHDVPASGTWCDRCRTVPVLDPGQRCAWCSGPVRGLPSGSPTITPRDLRRITRRLDRRAAASSR